MYFRYWRYDLCTTLRQQWLKDGPPGNAGFNFYYAQFYPVNVNVDINAEITKIPQIDPRNRFDFNEGRSIYYNKMLVWIEKRNYEIYKKNLNISNWFPILFSSSPSIFIDAMFVVFLFENLYSWPVTVVGRRRPVSKHIDRMKRMNRWLSLVRCSWNRPNSNLLTLQRIEYIYQ